MELTIVRTPYGVEVANQSDLKHLKIGKHYDVKVTEKRNPKFHNKFFVLMQIAFNAFEPKETTYKGLPVQKEFKRFYKDVLIAAGHYDPVFCIDGSVKAEAHSVAYEAMEPDRFEKAYNDCLTVIIEKIYMGNEDPETINNSVDAMLSQFG